MPFSVAGLATALPPFSVGQIDAARASSAANGESERQARLVEALYRRSGVSTRHLTILDGPTEPGEAVDQIFYTPPTDDFPQGPTTAQRMDRYETDAPVLATRACQNALAAAAVDPESIGHLVTVSCSGFAAPGVDIHLFDRLGLPRNTSRSHVGFMGCHGALNGLRVASALAAAAAEQTPATPNVLLCAVELCSLHHQFTDHPELIVANSLFSDGAAALVGFHVPTSAWGGTERAASDNGTTPSAGWTHRASGSWIVPGTTDLMGWRIRDAGFQMNLSPRVPEVIKADLKPYLSHWLDRQGLSLEEIAGWAIHPGGPRIVSATAETLGLSEEQVAPSRDVLSRFGNMSSPTLLFILDEMRQTGVTGPVVALGFGPGLTIETALFEAS